MAKINNNTDTMSSSKSKKNKTELKLVVGGPRDQDVLCGKEKMCVQHEGSRRFRALIDEYAPKYATAVSKNDRMAVTLEIYEKFTIDMQARFLKYNSRRQCWEQLTSLLSRDKISHALRFANRDAKDTVSVSVSKKGHRRTGSDATESTAATEFSFDDMEDLDVEPLDINTPEVYDAPASEGEEEAPYAPAYGEYSYPERPYSEAPYYDYHSYYYHHGYYNSHYYPYHYPQQYPPMAAYPAYPPPPTEPQSSPEEPTRGAIPVRKTSADSMDLNFLVSEPFMEWDLETEEVFVVNEV